LRYAGGRYHGPARSDWPLAALAVGVTLMGWITVEMVIFAGLTSLFWAFYLVLGTVIAAVGVAWTRTKSARSAGRTRGGL